MTKINYILIFVILSIVITTSLVCSSQFTYLKKDNLLTNFSSTSAISLVPFADYFSLERCTGDFSASIPSLNLSENESLNITIDFNVSSINPSCPDTFLYNIVNYLNSNKGLSVIYADISSEDEKQAAFNLAKLFNLSIYSDFEISELNASALFIGNHNILAKKTLGYFYLNETESLIYAEEDENISYIAISGYNSTYTMNSLELLTQIYNDYFKDKCPIITSDCSIQGTADYNGDGNINTQEIISYSNRFVEGMTDMKSAVREINNWLNQ